MLSKIRQAHEEDVDRVKHLFPDIYERESQLIAILDRAKPYMKHDKLCGITGGYGYCTCGLDELLEDMK